MLFVWLLWGDFCFTLMETVVPSIVPLHLKNLQCPNWLVGMILSTIPNLMGMTIAPYISVKSDRCRSRWGRRIPYLALTTPVAALAIAGFAYSPVIGRTVARLFGTAENPAILWTLGIFWGVFEVATVISGAIFGALVNDVVPHPLLGRFYGRFWRGK